MSSKTAAHIITPGASLNERGAITSSGFHVVEVNVSTGVPTSISRMEAIVVSVDDVKTAAAVVSKVRNLAPTSFIVVFSNVISNSALGRYSLIAPGANMVTHVPSVLQHALSIVFKEGGGELSCPWCAKAGLTPEQLWHHAPLFHINVKNVPTSKCPICQGSDKNPLMVHIHDAHIDLGGPDAHNNTRARCKISMIMSVIVLDTNKQNVCLVHPGGGSAALSLPRAAIAAGTPSSAIEAAPKVVQDQAELRNLTIDGVVQIKIVPTENHIVEMEMTLLAHNVSGGQLKTLPDHQSGGAVWMPFERVEQALAASPALSADANNCFDPNTERVLKEFIANGKSAHALSVMAREWDPVKFVKSR